MTTFISVDAKYHRCRVLALRCHEATVDVVLEVETAEQFVAEQAFATGDGWVAGTLAAPLEVCFVYGTTSEARAEALLFDHWRSQGCILEVTKSIEAQGILVVEPSTGLFTGMRLSPSELDRADGETIARP